jgi:hypothetical protein
LNKIGEKYGKEEQIREKAYDKFEKQTKLNEQP